MLKYYYYYLLILSTVLLSSSTIQAQIPQPAAPPEPASTDSIQKEGGIAVSPTRFFFTAKPGTKQIKTLKISNNSKKAQKFELKFSDYEMNKSGKSGYQKQGTHSNTIGDWIVFSPTFFEVLPGQSQKITATLNVPDAPDAYRAKWGILFINQTKERKSLDVTPSDQTIAMGVIPSMSFGIWVYQNPPNVAVKKVEINNFAEITLPTDSSVRLELKVKNVGDGISFVTSYIETVNTKTGKKERLGKKMLTILPNHDREIIFILPKNLDKGHYTAVGVLDFGSKEEIQAAELEFTVK